MNIKYLFLKLTDSKEALDINPHSHGLTDFTKYRLFLCFFIHEFVKVIKLTNGPAGSFNPMVMCSLSFIAGISSIRSSVYPMEDPWPPTGQTLPPAVSGIWISFLAGNLSLDTGHSCWSQGPGGELWMPFYSKSPLPAHPTSQRELWRTGPRSQTAVAAGLDLRKKTARLSFLPSCFALLLSGICIC